MAESLHAEVETSGHGRSPRAPDPAAPGLDPLSRHIAASFRGAGPDPRRLSAGAVLALQRAAGNRAVGALLQAGRAPGPHSAQGQGARLVQRMREDEVKSIFARSLDAWDGLIAPLSGKKPAADVFKAIAAEATAYEQSSRHGVDGREKSMKNALEKFLATTLDAWATGKPPGPAEANAFLTDAAYWAGQVRTLVEADRRRRAEMTARAAGAIRDNAPRPGVIPLRERVLVECAMGQGVAADLAKFVLHSDGFSSCTAIVMFNAGNRMGGLFHFAAGFRKQARTPQSDELRTLFTRVAPTLITIDERRDMPGDFADLSDFFVRRCGFQGEIIPWKEAGAAYAYLGDQDRLRITKSIDTEHMRLNLTSTDRLPDEVAATGAVHMVHHEESYSNLFSK